tara:strand:+ start:189 stop:446 length:258 start_codon:yes stop_codon:yes gene_type:complete
MEQILKDFIDNNEANDAIVGKVTYISLEDVDRLLKKQMSKEEVVEMLMYFAKWESEMFYKYMDDEDGGKAAFTEFVEDYLNRDLM